jgi:membrane protease YdiL (CAAX protease family)
VVAGLSVGIVAAGLLPVVYNLLPNPVWVRWYWRNKDAPVPEHVSRQVQRVDERYLPLAALAFVAIAIGILLNRSEIMMNRYWRLASGWELAYGLVAGLAWQMLSAVVLWPVRSAKLFTGRWELRVGWPYWLALSASAATIEEFWRAVCLAGLQELGKGFAISITSVAFGVAHGIRPIRIITTAAFSVYACWLLLRFDSLVVPVVAHFVVNVGVRAGMQAQISRRGRLP